MEQLLIPVHSLPEEGLALRETLPCAFVGELLGEEPLFAPTGSGSLQADLSRVSDALLLRGRVELPLSAPCSRCSERSDVALGWKLDVTLVPETAAPKPDEEGALSADDAGVFTYTDDEVDVGEVLRDELLLNLPMQTLCRPDCQGLCSSCGASLNDESCRCAAAEPEGPLAKLAHIRLPNAAHNKSSKR